MGGFVSRSRYWNKVMEIASSYSRMNVLTLGCLAVICCPVPYLLLWFKYQVLSSGFFFSIFLFFKAVAAIGRVVCWRVSFSQLGHRIILILKIEIIMGFRTAFLTLPWSLASASIFSLVAGDKDLTAQHKTHLLAPGFARKLGTLNQFSLFCFFFFQLI